MKSKKATQLEALKLKVEKANKYLKNLHMIAEAFEIYFFEYEKDWEINIEQFNEDLFHTQDFDHKYQICGPKIHIWDFKNYNELQTCIGICENEQYACVGSSSKMMFGRLDNVRPIGDAIELIEEGKFEKYELNVEKLNKAMNDFLDFFIERGQKTRDYIAKFIMTTIPQFYLSYGGEASGVHHDGDGPYIEFCLGWDIDNERNHPSGTFEVEYRVCQLAVQYWLKKEKQELFHFSKSNFEEAFNGKEKYIRVARFKNYSGIGFEVEYEDGMKESWLFMDKDWTRKQQYLSEMLFEYMHEAWTHDFDLTFKLEKEWEYDHDEFWGITRKRKDNYLHRWVKKGWYPFTISYNHVCDPNYFKQMLGDSEKYKSLLDHYEQKLDQMRRERKKKLEVLGKKFEMLDEVRKELRSKG